MTFWCARSLIQIFIVTFFFIIILVLIILIKYANNFNNVNDTCEHHHLTILLIHESIKNYLHYILFIYTKLHYIIWRIYTQHNWVPRHKKTMRSPFSFAGKLVINRYNLCFLLKIRISRWKQSLNWWIWSNFWSCE
jgi:type II secretory pathway component PulF